MTINFARRLSLRCATSIVETAQTSDEVFVQQDNYQFLSADQVAALVRVMRGRMLVQRVECALNEKIGNAAERHADGRRRSADSEKTQKQHDSRTHDRSVVCHCTAGTLVSLRPRLCRFSPRLTTDDWRFSARTRRLEASHDRPRRCNSAMLLLFLFFSYVQLTKDTLTVVKSEAQLVLRIAHFHPECQASAKQRSPRSHGWQLCCVWMGECVYRWACVG